MHRGDLHTISFSVWWPSGNVRVAVFTMNRPDEDVNARRSRFARNAMSSPSACGKQRRCTTSPPDSGARRAACVGQIGVLSVVAYVLMSGLHRLGLTRGFLPYSSREIIRV